MVTRGRDLGLMSRPNLAGEARDGTHCHVLPGKTTPKRLFLDPCKGQSMIHDMFIKCYKSIIY